MRRIALAVVTTLSLTLVPFAVYAQERRNDPDTYRISPEDMLQISVWKNAAMSRTVPVRPDGKISLPLIDDVQAAGVTAVELRDVLTTKLKEFIPSPEVSVIVADVRSVKVCLSAEETTRPGCYEVRAWATVLDVLALTGDMVGVPAKPDRLPLRRFLPRPIPAPYWWDRG